MDLIIKKRSKSTFTIKCEPKVIDDVMLLLTNMFSVTKQMKKLARFHTADKKACDKKLLEQHRKQYDSISKAIFKKFEAYEEKGLTRSQIIKKIKLEEGLLYYTCEVYIDRGRQILKAEKNSRIKKQYDVGKYSIAELARKNKVTYNTIKRIVKGNGKAVTNQ